VNIRTTYHIKKRKCLCRELPVYRPFSSKGSSTPGPQQSPGSGGGKVYEKGSGVPLSEAGTAKSLWGLGKEEGRGNDIKNVSIERDDSSVFC